MAKYEYILRQAGREDESLISDVDSAEVGDVVTIRNRPWRIVEIEPSDDATVTERKILEPAD